MNDNTKISAVFPPFSGNITADAVNMLMLNLKKKTALHVKEVADTCASIGYTYYIDEEKCRIAGILHDIAMICTDEDMLTLAKEYGIKMCAEEEKFAVLLHQKISALIAREHFKVADREILSAIECHTTLKAEPSKLDMALFIADKLSTDTGGLPPYFDAVYAALQDSLEDACLAYIEYQLGSGKMLCVHPLLSEAYEYLKH